MTVNLPFVSIIVAAYNAEESIERCLEHLLNLDYPDYEIIVVDNNSTDKTPGLIKKYNVIYLIEEKRGWPAARSRGIKYSKADFVANIDSDCFAEKEWLKILISNLICDSQIGGVVGRTRVEEGKTLLEQYYAECDPFSFEKYIGKKKQFIPWGGGNNLYKKQLFKKVGYYDSERYTSGADIEFHQRVKDKSNYRIKYVPEAVIYHIARNKIKDLFTTAAKYTYDGVIQSEQFPELRKRYSLFYVKKAKEIFKNIVGFFYRATKFIFGKEIKLKVVSPLFRNIGYFGNLYGYFMARKKLNSKSNVMFENLKKVAIIEPHYDDAWINLGGVILNHPEIKFKIISVSEDESNNKNETKKLEQLFPNIETQSLKLQGIKLGSKIPPKKRKEEFCKINNFKNFEELTKKIEQTTRGFDLVLLPLGLSHPQHTVVSDIKLSKKMLYYGEFPYFFPSRIRDWRNFSIYFRSKWQHYRLAYSKIKNKEKIIADISNSLKKKLEIFKQVYRTQLLILDLDKYQYKLSELKEEVLYKNNCEFRGLISSFSLYLGLLINEFSYHNFIDFPYFREKFREKLKRTPKYENNLNKTKKVLILYTGYKGLNPSGIMPGVPGTTIQHAKFLAKNGFEVTVMTALSCPDGNYNNVCYINIEDQQSFSKVLKKLKKYWDIVYCVGSPRLLKQTYNMPYLKSARLRILVVHSLLVFKEPERIKIINEYADIVICVSQAVKDKLKQYGVNPEKLCIVYNGVNEKIFHPCCFKRDMKRVVFAGAVIPKKGIDTLLLAFKKVKEKIPDAKLIICGSGEFYGRKTYQPDKSLIPQDGSVKFLGEISQKELAKEFSKSALAVFPSSKKLGTESFGKVSIEAQACGCPAIISDNGGLPETVVDGVTGKIFPSDDFCTFASVITELLSTPEKLKEMGIQAEKHITENFLIEKTFQPLKNIIEQNICNEK